MQRLSRRRHQPRSTLFPLGRSPSRSTLRRQKAVSVVKKAGRAVAVAGLVKMAGGLEGCLGEG
eukprot:1257168-Pleurochrysis_carterae.AAC.1